MFQKIKAEVQIFVTLVIAAVVLVFLSTTVGVISTPQTGAAPTETPAAVDAFSEDQLTDFGVSPQVVIGSNYNLQVSVISNKSTYNAGETAEFTVKIQNLGPDNLASGVIFSNASSAQLTNVTPNFSAIDVAQSSQTNPSWLLIDPISKGSSVQFKVTAKIAPASCDGTASYTAQTRRWALPQNQWNRTISFNINGTEECAGDIYFPLISKFPTPTPPPIFFFDDFSDDDSGWDEINFVGGGIDCESEYDGGEYEVRIAEDTYCFAPAPDDAERRTGSVQVQAQYDGDSDSEEYYAGVYMNGKGDDQYYLYQIRFDNDGDCTWVLERTDDTKRSGNCNGDKGPRSTNTLKISHDGNGNVSMYLNGLLQGTYKDSSPYTGKGTGLYLKEKGSDGELIIDFDNFTVFSQ